MKKPELLVTASHLEELVQLLDHGADAATIGNEKFSLRLPGSFTISEVEQAVAEAHTRGKKIYVAVNALFHNEMLNGLDLYLKKLQEIGVDAVEYADPAVLMIAKNAAPELPLHWNPEIIATSFHTLQYWQSKGIKRAWLSRELNMEEILEMKSHVDIEIGIQVHGMSCIFHSKRALVQSYFGHLDHNENRQTNNKERGLYLKEEKRDDITYPIFEDQSGTHIMSSEDMCILENLDELIDGSIDSFRIETLLKPISYNEVVVRTYRRAIDLYLEDADLYFEHLGEWMQSIQEIQDPKRPLSTGFYFKELIF